MSFLNKLKTLTENTIDSTKQTIVDTKKEYNDGGIEAIGFKVGKTTTTFVNTLSSYSSDVIDTSKKASNRSKLVFNESQPNSQTAAKIALGLIAGIRKVGLDATDQIESKLNNLSTPKPKK